MPQSASNRPADTTPISGHTARRYTAMKAGQRVVFWAVMLMGFSPIERDLMLAAAEDLRSRTRRLWRRSKRN